MVQIIQKENPNARLTEMLGLSLGQGIGNGLITHFANRSLDSVMKDKSLEGAPASKKLEAIRSALSPYGEKGQEIFKQRMEIEQQEMQEQEQDILGRIVAGEKVSSKDIGKLKPETQLKVMELQKRRESGKSIHDSLIKAGYPEETAQLWQNQIENSPIGGQTDTIKEVNNLIRRSKPGKGLGAEQETKETIQPSIDIPGTSLGPLELDFPELPEPIGVTSADMVRQNEYREKTNIPLYTETVDRLNSLDEEYRAVKHLQELNEIPGALPEGIERWNVNWDTGELRVKAAATPEAQDYVKTIALLARRAKDFFPGRVTNFDLDQFKAGFPTLANDAEGRRIIAEQLALGNRIAYLKDETYKAAMDHYGSGADPVLIKKYATENYRRLKSQLENELKHVNTQAKAIVDRESAQSKRPALDEIFK